MPTDANGNSTQTITVDPTATGVTSVSISFQSVDSAGKTSANTGSGVMSFPGLTISGSVLNDVNGSLIDGVGIGSPSETQVYAILVIPTTVDLVGTMPVAANGTYSLGTANGEQANTNFNVVVSTVQGVAATVTGATSILLAGWVSTADGRGGTIGDGTPNAITLESVVTTNITNVDFGIE